MKGETLDESGGGGASDDARKRFADEDIWKKRDRCETTSSEVNCCRADTSARLVRFASQ